jgi:hypothetical protein
MENRMRLQTQYTRRLSTRESARLIADLFCLWRLCAKPGCRRARACRGDARACLTGLPLVPPEALLFLKAMDEGRGFLSFDEMMERHEEEWAAVEDWCELVKSTLPESRVWLEE